MFNIIFLILLLSVSSLVTGVSDVGFNELLLAQEDYVRLEWKDKKLSSCINCVKKICGKETPKECLCFIDLMDKGYESAPVCRVMKMINKAVQALEQKSATNEKLVVEIKKVVAEIDEYLEYLQADKLWITQLEIDKALRKKSDEAMYQLLNSEIPKGKVMRVPTNIVDNDSSDD